METLTVGIRHHTVAIAMNDDGRSLILRSCLVDRQCESCTDIVTTEFQTAEEFDILTRIEGVVHLTHRTALDGILTQYGSRRHQCHSLEGRLT